MSYFCQEELFKSEKKHYSSVYLGIKGSLRQGSIPKEAPWKTLVLNEQFLGKRNREFSTTTSGTERKRGFVGILPCWSVPNNNIKKQPATLSK